MRLLLAAGPIELALVLAVQWVWGRQDVPGRVRRFPAVRMCLCLALGAVTTVTGLRGAGFEDRLAAAASVLAGKRVQVHCESAAAVHTGRELGWVWINSLGQPEAATTITHDTCGHLRHWLEAGRSADDLQEVISVHVLSHETMHMAGTVDEGRAECAAVQRDAQLAVLLGADPRQGQRLANRYWREVYPRMEANYLNDGCHAGGGLDEGRPGAPWGA